MDTYTKVDIFDPNLFIGPFIKNIHYEGNLDEFAVWCDKAITVLPNLERLHCPNLPKIPWYITVLKNLKILECNTCKIPDSLISLCELDIRSVTSEVAIPETFTNLQKLRFYDCYDVIIPILPNLTMLSVIGIDNIVLVPEKLQSIRLANFIQISRLALPISMMNITTLTIRNIGKKIRLPKYLPQLITLTLTNSKVSKLPKSYTTLDLLDISYSAVPKIPNSYKQLRILICNRSSGISEIPAFDNITYLDIRGTDVVYLPYLPKLREIMYNSIREFPDIFLSQSLERIYLDDTEINVMLREMDRYERLACESHNYTVKSSRL
jgi:hypothetical protein